MSNSRLGAALMPALTASVAVFYFGNGLLASHGWIVGFLLKQTRVPVEGTSTVDVFPRLDPAAVPDAPFPQARENRARTALLFGASVAGLIIVDRRYPLGRNFAVFLVILLGSAAVVAVLNPSFHFSSATFCQI